MAWISVHEQVVGGKLRSLAKEIGCSQNEALGMLVRLWLWGINNNVSPYGKIVSASKEDLADILNVGIDRRYESENAVEAMINTHWIDNSDGSLYIHDWEEWQKQWYKAMRVREADKERKAKERENRRERNKVALYPEPACEKVDLDRTELSEDPAKGKKSAYTNGFELFWNAYPRKIGKGEAYKCYLARLKDGWNPEELLQAAREYASAAAREHTELRFIKHPKTFLSASTPFADYVKNVKERPQEREDLDAMYAEWGGSK